MKKSLIIIILFLLCYPVITYSQTLKDYLILNDIGEYKYRPKRTNEIYGNSGILISTGHFTLDHDDITYETRYVHPETILGVKVQVTQHAGSDSDRWLLHEVERGFRRGDYEENMTAARFRNINGNNVFYSGLGGGTYRWISNYIVVSIEYTDLYKQKPEPIEVVKAYLAKFPSTIPAVTIDQAHNEQWIKDEMERRLWLCDRWFYQLQLKKVELRKTLREAVDHMKVFLDYREKYYGISAKDEKNLLSSYLLQNNGTGIKNKLKEYKEWWSANKGKAITL